MAKKSYSLYDDRGFRWIVREGDPAFPLVSRLKYPEPVLPFSTLLSGTLPEHNDKVRQRIVRLARALAVDEEDSDLHEELQRTINLAACLDLLRPRACERHPPDGGGGNVFPEDMAWDRPCTCE